METHKGMANLEIARLLRGVAAALQIKSKLPTVRFQVVAYQNAADSIEHLTSEAKDLWDDQELDKIPGVGKTIAERLDELFKTGKVKHFEETFEGLPPAMFELMEVPGIGAKRAYKLAQELGINKAHGALEKLAHAADKGHIRDIEGFGEQIEKEILESVSQVKERSRRLLLPHATIITEGILEWMKKCPQAKIIEPLGSLRRSASTVGDIDIAVATDKPKLVIEHFTKYPKKVKLIEAGPLSSSLLLAGGVQVDLMVQPEDHFGALLQHFTGSKHHNVALRTYALKKKLSLSEKGIKFDGKGEVKGYRTEREFYEALGMDWIPPELREGKGEIESALKHKLPQLVELKDIKGDLHMHTNYFPETSHDSGANSMEEMVEVGTKLGYEYMGFTEHNLKSSLSEEKTLDALKKRQEEIGKLNDKLHTHSDALLLNAKLKHVFTGLEIDIQPSGKLSIPEKGFDYLDYAVVSLHSSFRGDRADQTKRVLSGLDHPKVRIFGHPTGRKLQEREGAELDWEKIFDFCLKNNKWLEINSSPDRLDLPDSLVFDAVKKGVKHVIDTDAHEVGWLSGMRYGVSVARRGWAERQDIVNTLTLREFESILNQR